MKNASVFVGRFQPFTKGHAAAVKKMIVDDLGEPIIAIVRGKKSSLNLTRNPFSESLQRLMILNSLGKEGITNKNIIVIPSAYILEILNPIEQKGYTLKNIYAGGDGDDDNRLASYKSLLMKAKMPGTKELIKDHFNLDISYKDTMNKGKRLSGVSGTLVRQSLEDNDYKTFKKGTGFDYAMFIKLKKVYWIGKIKMAKDKLK